MYCLRYPGSFSLMHKQCSGCSWWVDNSPPGGGVGTQLPHLGLLHTLKTFSPFVPGWRSNKERSSTAPPPKALAGITSLTSGGKISVTWPHFTARRMGNEAWLCCLPLASELWTEMTYVISRHKHLNTVLFLTFPVSPPQPPSRVGLVHFPATEIGCLPGSIQLTYSLPGF